MDKDWDPVQLLNAIAQWNSPNPFITYFYFFIFTFFTFTIFIFNGWDLKLQM